MSEARPARIHVLAWPGFHEMPNPHAAALFTEIAALGVQVEDFRPARVLRTDARIWHIQAPDYVVGERSTPRAFGKVAAFLGLLAVAKARGMRVVWTVNNLRSHERRHPLLERVLWWGFLRSVDAHIHYGPASVRALPGSPHRLSRVPARVIPHGHYRDQYENVVAAGEARDRLGVPREALVAAFLGSIRAYKNVPALVEAFRSLADRSAILLVAGNPDGSDSRSAVVEAAGGDPSVRLSLRTVPAADVQLYLNAADLVVLPFRDILNSGSALLALSFGRPVLVPALGAMIDLRDAVGDAWVRTYEGPLGSETLREGLRWARQTPRSEAPPLEGLDWPSIARRTVEVYETVLGR
jgi:glycosyltransferase involved in cell wall biosynthesis